MDWVKRVRGGNTKALKDTEAIHNVLWRAARNNWFEYPLGSRLIFFCFPMRYCTQAKSGVRVFYTCKGPSSRQCQPPLKPDKKAILKKKILKFVGKSYLAPPVGRIGSLIKYFAIPKGVIDNVVQDWRIVFHAGANKLNDCVWAPLFCLPTVNLLLWITDKKSLMRDQDLGKMFLLFQLHPNTAKFTAINLGPLEFSAKECVHCLMCWLRNLMGFKSSPYRMYLVSEEIISKVTAAIQTTPSNGIPFFLTYREQGDTSQHCHGYQSAGTMGLWQVTSSALWMTFKSQGKDVGKSGKLATPSVCDRVIWEFRMLYGSSDWRMEHDGQELGPG
jgi:hypothetical protein